jgi:APA family basic amino acid/polyamine antiporter
LTAIERTTREHLIRGIGRWDLVALVINSVIGAGIFGLPAKLYDLAGPYSLFAFIACALFVALLLLCFAEV